MKKNIVVVRTLTDFRDNCSDLDFKECLVVYCRVSTKQQIKTESLNDQQRLGIEFYQKDKQFKSFKHIIVFREEGFSGDDYNVNEESLIKRKLLPIILSNIKLFKHIWVIDTNRLGRSVQIISYLTIEFSKHNISLYVNGVLRNLNEMGDKFLIQLMGLVDEIENEKRFVRGTIGKLSSIRKGQHWGGRHLFGYKRGKRNGDIIIDEEKSKIVKHIYNMCNNGESIHNIIEYLKNNNINPPIKNGLWNESTIRNILRNETYIGKKQFIVKTMKKVDKEECIELGHYEKIEQNDLPKIIDDELFKSVQKRMKKNYQTKQHINRCKTKYLLRNILFCGNCGRRMSINSNKKRNIGVYQCNYKVDKWKNRVKEDDIECGLHRTKSVNIKVVENLVWNELVNILRDSYKIKEKFKNEFLKTVYKMRNNPKQRIEEIDNEIKELKDKIELVEKRKIQIIKKFVTIDISDSHYKILMDEIDSEIDTINNDIVKREIEKSEVGGDLRWYDWLSEFDKKYTEIKDLESIEDKRKIIENHINRIDVYWDCITKTHTLKIHFNLKIVRDKRKKIGKYQFEISEGRNYSDINDINSNHLSRKLNNKTTDKLLLPNHSTVTDLARFRG